MPIHKMQTILSQTGKDKLGKTKRSISEIQVIFLFPFLHSYFGSPKLNRFDTLYVALTQT